MCIAARSVCDSRGASQAIWKQAVIRLQPVERQYTSQILLRIDSQRLVGNLKPLKKKLMQLSKQVRYVPKNIKMLLSKRLLRPNTPYTLTPKKKLNGMYDHTSPLSTGIRYSFFPEYKLHLRKARVTHNHTFALTSMYLHCTSPVHESYAHLRTCHEK